MDGPAPTVTTLEQLMAGLTQQVQAVEQRIQAAKRWDDRMGSALTAAWHWRLIAIGLLGVNVALGWLAWQPRADIIPYLFVVNPEGVILEELRPGQTPLTITDVMVMNHVEDFIKQARFRTPDMVAMQLLWDRAVKLTAEQSEARLAFNAYMDEENPLKKMPKPRVEVQVLSKRPLHTDTYRLNWIERAIGVSGQVASQVQWEGDFVVTIQPPKKLEDVAKVRYGVLITSYSWGPRAMPTGG